MLPADPAARAGSTPEASRDSSSGTLGINIALFMFDDLFKSIFGKTEKPAKAPLLGRIYVANRYPCENCSKIMVLTDEEHDARRYSCPYCNISGTVDIARILEPPPVRTKPKSYSTPAVPPPATEYPSYNDLRFSCPRCDKEMILTAKEYRERKYHCPYCNSPFGAFPEPAIPIRYSLPTSGRCTRCGRYAKELVYYNGKPYGRQCVRLVSGW